MKQILLCGDDQSWTPGFLSLAEEAGLEVLRIKTQGEAEKALAGVGPADVGGAEGPQAGGPQAEGERDDGLPAELVSLRRRLRIEEQARELALEVTGCLSLVEALEVLAGGLCRLLTPAHVAIFLREEGTDHLAMKAHCGAMASGLKALPDVEDLARRAVGARASGHEGPDAPQGTVRERGLFATPIAVRGRALGALVADLSACDGLRGVYEQVLIDIADVAGTAIDNARTHERTLERSHYMSTLYELGRHISSVTDVEELLHVIVDNAARLTLAERCSLMLIDEQTQTLRIRASRGVPEEIVKTTRIRVGEGVAGYVATHGEPLLVRDIAKDTRFRPRQSVDQYTNNSLLCVPLKFRGQVTGVLNANNKVGKAPFTPEDLELLTLLANHAAVAIENAALYANLREMAATDGLTGLYNHQHFFSQLRAAVGSARRTGQPLCVVMVDIDHFKRVNDSYGHGQGDTVLRALASIIRKTVRREDVAARYGGEEFAMIATNSDLEGARQLAERLRRQVRRLAFQRDGETFSITVSVGIAPLEPGLDAETLADRADQALYLAKRRGRDRICRYDEVDPDGEDLHEWERAHKHEAA